jgi:hypothetical protein
VFFEVETKFLNFIKDNFLLERVKHFSVITLLFILSFFPIRLSIETEQFVLAVTPYIHVSKAAIYSLGPVIDCTNW